MLNCGGDGLTHWGGWLSTLILLVIASLGLWMFSKARKIREAGRDKDDSLQILKNRLARGEITLEEYASLKKVL